MRMEKGNAGIKPVAYLLLLFLCLQIGMTGGEYRIVKAETSGDWEYKIRNDGMVEITKYKGNSVEVSKPAELDGKVVMCIGNSAFADCTSITSIIIPQGVKHIGAFAFYMCTNLNSIVIPEGVMRIESNAFADCKELSSIIMPESVEYIGSCAFYGCKNLSGIKISDGVEYIGDSAFYNCTSLSGISIPESVKYIGNFAFDSTLWIEDRRKEETLVVRNGILIDGEMCSGDIIIPEGVNKKIGRAHV